jgi:hypothetical protein
MEIEKNATQPTFLRRGLAAGAAIAAAAVAGGLATAVVRGVVALYWTPRAANYVAWMTALAGVFYFWAYSVYERGSTAAAALVVPPLMLWPLAWFGPEPSLAYVLAFFAAGAFVWWYARWFAALADLIVRRCDGKCCGAHRRPASSSLSPPR